MTKTILIVDAGTCSNPNIQQMVTQWGYQAHLATSAANALQTQQKFKPKVVIVSDRLVDMDVEDFLRKLRQNQQEPEVLLICRRRGLSKVAGWLKPLISGIISRPVYPEELEIILGGAFERIRLRRQLQCVKREAARRVRYSETQIENERFLTVKQIVDKVSTFIGELAREVEGGVRYFNEIPYFIAIHDRQCRVVLKCESNPDAIGMSVEDNGLGMTSEQLKRLFTVFYSTKGIKGTGLGLFIADQIIRQHGGDIAVESSLGQGSRFCVRLPREPKRETPPGQQKT